LFQLEFKDVHPPDNNSSQDKNVTISMYHYIWSFVIPIYWHFFHANVRFRETQPDNRDGFLPQTLPMDIRYRLTKLVITLTRQ